MGVFRVGIDKNMKNLFEYVIQRYTNGKWVNWSYLHSKISIYFRLRELENEGNIVNWESYHEI